MSNLHQLIKYQHKNNILQHENITMHGGVKCINRCGRSATKNTCCRACNGYNGPHTSACDTRNGVSNPSMISIRGGPVIITVGNIGHVTICYINKGKISQQCYNKLQQYFSRINRPRPGLVGSYKIIFSKMMGQNSALLDPSTQLAKMQENIFDKIQQILAKYGFSGLINTTRYSSGIPPAHIDIKGNQHIFIKYSNKAKIQKETIMFDYKALQ